MTRLVLDSSALGMLCHPKSPKNKPFAEAVSQVLRSSPGDTQICIPAVADYELRRKLLQLVDSGKADRVSLQRLNQLCAGLTYLELTSATWRRAAEFWAELRLAGRPTSPPDALDADVLLAAQTAEIDGWAVTTNLRHLARLVPVIRPADIRNSEKRVIPDRANLAPPAGFIYVKMAGVGPVWLRLGSLKAAGDATSSLSDSQQERIADVFHRIGEYVGIPWLEWNANFSNDHDPESELLAWERMARVFELEIADRNPLSEKERSLLYQTILFASVASSVEGLVSARPQTKSVSHLARIFPRVHH